MLHPTTSALLDTRKLRRKAELALAAHRDAWERNAHEDEQDAAHEKACKAVAAIRVYDIARDPRAPFVDTAQFWTLVERFSNSHDFRAEMRYPSK